MPPPAEHLPGHAWYEAAELIFPPGGDRSPDWISTRRLGLGGSDVAAVLGLSPFATPLRVYLDKLGRVDPLELTEEMEWGIRLEDAVAQKFADETGLQIARTGMWRSRRWPWLLANPDRAIRGQSAGLECKTADMRYLPDWADEPPLHYVVQCVTYMAVTGARRWYLAALVGGNHWFVYTIDRDDDDIAAIVETTRRFWDLNLNRQVPPRVQRPAARAEERLLALLYPDPDGEAIQLTAEQRELVAEHKRVTSHRGELDKQATALAAQIKQFLGTKTFGYAGTRKAVSWPARKDGVRVLNNHWKEQD